MWTKPYAYHPATFVIIPHVSMLCRHERSVAAVENVGRAFLYAIGNKNTFLSESESRVQFPRRAAEAKHCFMPQ